MNRKYKILVTGSSGFMGTNLKKRLEAENHYVCPYDLENGCDINDTKMLTKLIKQKFDVIYHLAGFSGSSRSNQESKKTFKLNTLSVINIIKLIIKLSPQTKLILSGSRLEYGTPKYLPVDEYHPTEPISVYGLSKLNASQIALTFAKSHSLKTTVFRISNVYGPHPKNNFQGYNVINHFLDLAIKNKEITIFGNGNQIRDYIFIDDLLTVFLLGINDKANGKIYNVGFGKPIKIKDMAKIIIKTAGKGKLVYSSWPKEFKSVETGDYITDIKKIRKELKFKPLIDFKTGVFKTYSSML